METTKRAVTYIRVSSREQATEDKASLEVQQLDCDAYCRRKDYEKSVRHMWMSSLVPTAVKKGLHLS